MNKGITVNEAIKTGIWCIKLPIIIIVLGFICFGIYISFIYSFSKYYFILIVFTGIISAFLYSLFIVPKWKIWAFGNVRNVHELKTKAISKKIISTEMDWMSRNEFFFGSDKQKWEEIQKKFLFPDEINANQVIENEISVYNSGFKLIIPIVFYAICFIWSILTIIFDENSRGMGIMFLTIFGLFLYFKI